MRNEIREDYNGKGSKCYGMSFRSFPLTFRCWNSVCVYEEDMCGSHVWWKKVEGGRVGRRENGNEDKRRKKEMIMHTREEREKARIS